MMSNGKKLFKIIGWVFMAVLIYQLGYVSGKGAGNTEAEYEGGSAMEWADESDYWQVKYEKFRECVEDYSLLNGGQDILLYCD